LFRKPKTYDDSITAAIYATLRNRKMGFNNWVKESKINRTTLNVYKHHGLELGEIEKEQGRRGKFFLTAKGQSELRRITDLQKIKKQRRHYFGKIDSMNELIPPSELWSLEANVKLLELPLPMPVEVGMYGSEELYPLFEWAEYQLSVHNGVGDKKLRPEFLKGSKSLIEPLLWTHIWERLTYILRWHGRYRLKLTNEAPPPLTVENVLGFDLSFRVDYEGKNLLKQSKLEEPYKIGKRLVGSVLLRLAYAQEGGSEYSTSDVIHLFVQSGLLERKDAQRIIRVLPRSRITRSGGGSHGGIVSLSSTEERRSTWAHRTEVILPIALRYLAEGGIVQVPKGSSPELLAKECLARPHITRLKSD